LAESGSSKFCPHSTILFIKKKSAGEIIAGGGGYFKNSQAAIMKAGRFSEKRAHLPDPNVLTY
jgi:hypothetical protein